MKYLKHFESYIDTDVKNSELSSEQIRELHKKSLEYLIYLSDSDKIRLKTDLEKFARDHGLNLSDLEDPKVVENLLKSQVNEGFKDWLKENWYSLVSKISKYTGLVALMTFVGSLGLNWIFGFETLPGVKIAAASWIISSVVGTLKGLR